MAVHTESIGDWVDQVFNKIFFQSDHHMSADAIGKYLSKDLRVTINGSLVPRERYTAAILGSRKKHIATKESSKELLCRTSDDHDDDGKSGTIALSVTFTAKNIETGMEVKKQTVTLVTVTVENDKRVMSQLTEVTNF